MVVRGEVLPKPDKALYEELREKLYSVFAFISIPLGAGFDLRIARCLQDKPSEQFRSRFNVSSLDGNVGAAIH